MSKLVSGFTLIELLVVIAIIGILSGIVLGFLNAARESGRITALIQFDTNINHTIGDQLVGEWKFEEAAGTTVFDTSGFGNNGTITGSYSRVKGVLGNALSLFLGSSVSIPPSNSLNLKKNSFTASIWMKTDNVNDMRVFSLAGDSNSAFLSNYQGYLRSCFGLPGNECDARTLFISDNKWHNVAVIGDSKSIRIYFDGKLRTDHIQSPSSAIMTGGLRLGSFSSYQGLLDDFRVYSAPLEVAQIQQLYAEGLQSHQDLALIK